MDVIFALLIQLLGIVMLCDVLVWLTFRTFLNKKISFGWFTRKVYKVIRHSVGAIILGLGKIVRGK